MQAQAKAVIIGAGIVGCSVAYHLTKMGWRDIVVLEQGPLHKAGGSTYHAPGLVFQTNFSRTMTKLAQYTVGFYNNLHWDSKPCFVPVGGMEVAYTEARWEDLKRKLGFARAWGVNADLITPQEAKEKIPLLDSSKIYGAYHVPSDGVAKAVSAIEALIKLAEANGATFIGNTRVTGVEVVNGQVKAVTTGTGRIATNIVVVCAGIWGPIIGRLAGVPIPLVPLQHQYVRTGPLRELKGETREVVHPILRHQDRSMYFRQHSESYGIGSYFHEPLLVAPEDIPTYNEAKMMPSVMDFTPQDFEKAFAAAVDLLPTLSKADSVYKINGMFSFTPDGMPLLGESQDVHGFWLAEAVWIAHAGGVGKVVAEWMVEGTPSLDLRECDLNRFHAYALTPTYLKARAEQNYREIYDIIHPLQQIKNIRNLRLSPFHKRLEELGAVFFENAGWERPQWLNSNGKLLNGKKVPTRSGWEALYWSSIQGAEHHATREGVAMYDLTPFTKIDVTGPKALDFLQNLCTNQMDQTVGRVVYTSLLNPKGGIMCDLTVTRLGPDYFRVITGTSVGMHDMAWFRSHLPDDNSVQLLDVTSSYCCIGLWGPKAPDVAEQVSKEDFSRDTFANFTAHRVKIGAVPAIALQVSYVGESGWEIYAPSEQGLVLWDTLWKAGESLGIAAGGSGAFDSLRLEKAYRLWGSDIHTEYNSYEAGLGFVVKLDKGNFIGKEALLQIKDRGISRKLCWMTLDTSGDVVMGKEPILDGEKVLGYVTSANYGYTVGKCIVMGYVPIEYSKEGTKVDVYYFGKRYPATVAKSLSSRYK